MGTNTQLLDVPIERCCHSRFNTRKHRDDEQIDRLADRIKRNGFERTRALWAVEVDGRYEVFAGGTRLEAAKRVGLETVPVFVHADLTDEEVSRRADDDNENDEYHVPVAVPDVWAECHRLSEEEGWTQQQIAEAKGWERTTVGRRISWHQSMPEVAKLAVWDGLLDEGHVQAISGVVWDVPHSAWLTTEQAQSELVQEVLDTHRGSTAGIKPSVTKVREAAKRWKSLLQAAEQALASLTDEPWRTQFVEALAAGKIRNEAGINRVLNQIVEKKRRDDDQEASRLRAEADNRERESQRLKLEAERMAAVETQVAKLQHGDARQLVAQAPHGFNLLLTDPPYGMDFQGHRRVVSASKPKIANDDELGAALALLSDVLKTAHPLMADNSTCLIFTSWRFEPDFRRVIRVAGFEIKGSLIWTKPNHGTGDLAGSFAPKHERIIHAVKGKPKLQRRAADVLGSRDRPVTEHPTEKPRDLLRTLIEATTEFGQTVVDPFFGSGSTLIAAHELGRDFFGCELDERWHGVAADTVFKRVQQEFEHGLAA